MEGFSFAFIGWCNEDKHDKVWGVFTYNKPCSTNVREWDGKYWGQDCFVFWGRRGAIPQFKRSTFSSDLTKLHRQKLDKGYVGINEKQLLNIFPKSSKS